MNRGMSMHSFPAYQHVSSSQPQTPAATENSNSSSVNAVPAFDFPVPTIPPRLSKVGRRISELGSSMLFPEDEIPRRGSREKQQQQRVDVPGMGDEPVMCPFCNKPLPPALFDAHRAPHSAAPRLGTSTPDKRGSAASLRGLGIRTGELTRSASIGPGLIDAGPMSAGAAPGYASHRSSLTKTLVEEPTDLNAVPEHDSVARGKALLESAEVVPKATAESFQPTVKAAEQADTAAAKSIISKDEIRRWSMVAGLPVSPEAVQSAAPPKSTATEAPAKSIPTLPPPPPPASKLVKPSPAPEKNESPGGTSRFGFFGRRKSKADEEDDEESDDDAPTSGYAKLTGPASPDRDFEDEDPMERIGKAKPAVAESKTPPEEIAAAEGTAGAVDEGTQAMAPAPVTPAMPATPASTTGNDAEVKGTLQEVIGKVNAMSKAHEDILHSHATLLTQLKIARSNLAMAEANTEMLEEQLKRNTRRSSSTSAAGPSAVIATPGGTASMPPPIISPGVSRKSLDVPTGSTKPSGSVPRAVSPSPINTNTTDAKQRASLEAPRAAPVVSPQPRRPAEAPDKPLRPRPNSIIMPPPNASNNGPSTSVAGENKGWSFWQGGKKKVPGLGNMKFTLPSADQIFDAIDAASRPPTPGAERQSFLGTSAPTSSQLGSPNGTLASGLPVPDPLSPTGRSGPGVGSPALARSTSSSAVTSPSMRTRAPISSPDYMGEMNRMRQAHAANQQRIEAMSKELAELRKGKVDMEAELENLSQALFEEANKMVADERRKRAEVEESLKEIKEEREALRQTVKLLNGQPEADNESIKAPSIKLPDDQDLPEEFVPRDLDKHYEALRKTIHHVGESATPASNPFESAINSTDYATREYVPDGSIPTVPEGREVELASDGGSPGRPRARSISAPSSPNPWALGAEPITGGGMGVLALGEDVDPLDSSKMALSFGQVGELATGLTPIGDVGPLPTTSSTTGSAIPISTEHDLEGAGKKELGVKGLGLKLSPETPTPPSPAKGASVEDGTAGAVNEQPKNEEGIEGR